MMNKPKNTAEDIAKKVRKNLEPYFIKFCSLDKLENCDIETKRAIYYYTVENIIPYIYESSFNEILCHPDIIKNLRKKLTVHWIMWGVYIIGIITGFFLGNIIKIKNL